MIERHTKPCGPNIVAMEGFLFRWSHIRVQKFFNPNVVRHANLFATHPRSCSLVRQVADTFIPALLMIYTISTTAKAHKELQWITKFPTNATFNRNAILVDRVVNTGGVQNLFARRILLMILTRSVGVERGWKPLFGVTQTAWCVCVCSLLALHPSRLMMHCQPGHW